MDHNHGTGSHASSQPTSTAKSGPKGRAPSPEKRTGATAIESRSAQQQGCPPSTLVVLSAWLANSYPSLNVLLRAYRELDLTGVRTAPEEHARPERAVPKRARWINEGERDRLVARYEAGAPVRELAVEFGLNRTTIAKQLKAAGVTLRGGPMTPEEISTCIELYATGMSTLAVAEAIRRDKSAVWRVLKEAGLAMRDRQGRERAS